MDNRYARRQKTNRLRYMYSGLNDHISTRLLSGTIIDGTKVMNNASMNNARMLGCSSYLEHSHKLAIGLIFVFAALIILVLFILHNSRF